MSSLRPAGIEYVLLSASRRTKLPDCTAADEGLPWLRRWTRIAGGPAVSSVGLRDSSLYLAVQACPRLICACMSETSCRTRSGTRAIEPHGVPSAVTWAVVKQTSTHVVPLSPSAKGNDSRKRSTPPSADLGSSGLGRCARQASSTRTWLTSMPGLTKPARPATTSSLMSDVRPDSIVMPNGLAALHGCERFEKPVHPFSMFSKRNLLPADPSMSAVKVYDPSPADTTSCTLVTPWLASALRHRPDSDLSSATVAPAAPAPWASETVVVGGVTTSVSGSSLTAGCT